MSLVLLLGWRVTAIALSCYISLFHWHRRRAQKQCKNETIFRHRVKQEILHLPDGALQLESYIFSDLLVSTCEQYSAIQGVGPQLLGVVPGIVFHLLQTLKDHRTTYIVPPIPMPSPISMEKAITIMFTGAASAWAIWQLHD